MYCLILTDMSSRCGLLTKIINHAALWVVSKDLVKRFYFACNHCLMYSDVRDLRVKSLVVNLTKLTVN